MSGIGVTGWGAVSPAGWGMAALRQVLAEAVPLPTQPLPRPGTAEALRVRAVPAASTRPAFLAHARMRRTSPIAQYAVAAALEALGTETPGPAPWRRGMVLCVMTGCVNYSRRFYAETLEDPSRASPLIFPETVFNAPASHLATLLGTREINYTLVGDAGTFLVGLALAAGWLQAGRVDECVVLGAEERDWLTSEALHLLNPGSTLAEGAGALCLRRVDSGDPAIRLDRITDAQLYVQGRCRVDAIRAVRAELPAALPRELLVDSQEGVPAQDAPEQLAWKDWPGPHLSPKTLLGEGFTAAAAWQCALAVDQLARERVPAAQVNVVGSNQQAIGARFLACSQAEGTTR